MASPQKHDYGTAETTVVQRSSRTSNELSLRRYCGLMASSVAVGFGWATGSATIIPHMKKLGVKSWLASWVWLFNPICGVFLSTAHGNATDNCECVYGKRRPFILGITLVASAAILGLISTSNKVVWVFFCYTVFDCCMDQLLIPGRALVSDLVPDSDLAYTRAQLIGRLLSMLVGCFKWPNILDLGEMDMFQYQFLFCLFVILVSCGGVWTAGAREARRRCTTVTRRDTGEYTSLSQATDIEISDTQLVVDDDAVRVASGETNVSQQIHLVVIFMVQCTGDTPSL